MLFQVVVRKFDDEDFCEVIGRELGERTAKKIERGVNINLNHDEYYTEVVEQGDEGQ